MKTLQDFQYKRAKTHCKFYSSTVVYFTMKFKRSSSEVVIGVFRSILLLTILMLSRQIF